MLAKAYQALVDALDSLPAVGPKEATRMADFLLKDGQGELLRKALEQAQSLQRCKSCWLYSEQEQCQECSKRAATQQLLVVAGVEHYQHALVKGWAGRFFVLPALLSPMAGIGPKHLGLDVLFAQLEETPSLAVTVALEPSAEGRATSAYIEANSQPAVLTITTWPQWHESYKY